jgi:hypothetical protein
VEGKLGGMWFADGENNLTDDEEKIEICGRTDVDLSNSAGEFNINFSDVNGL